MDVNDPKPPTQGIGVGGISSQHFGNDKILWEVLVHLPKFQMYAVEVAGRQYGHIGNVMEWIIGWMQDSIKRDSEQIFFDNYVQWHDKKGYWKNEDAYGVLI